MTIILIMAIPDVRIFFHIWRWGVVAVPRTHAFRSDTFFHS